MRRIAVFLIGATIAAACTGSGADTTLTTSPPETTLTTTLASATTTLPAPPELPQLATAADIFGLTGTNAFASRTTFNFTTESGSYVATIASVMEVVQSKAPNRAYVEGISVAYDSTVTMEAFFNEDGTVLLSTDGETFTVVDDPTFDDPEDIVGAQAVLDAVRGQRSEFVYVDTVALSGRTTWHYQGPAVLPALQAVSGVLEQLGPDATFEGVSDVFIDPAGFIVMFTLAAVEPEPTGNLNLSIGFLLTQFGGDLVLPTPPVGA